MDRIKVLGQIATRLRINVLNMTTAAGSGHPTTCLSMAELMSCLFFDEMKYDIKDPFNLANDEFVLSKGHAAPILWAAYAEAGIVEQDELIHLRKLFSNLEGHPTPRVPFVKAATGSLGQGLSVGLGMVLALSLAKSKARVYVMLGDGELAEGNVWEAAELASYYKANNLVAIVDANGLGQSGPTMHSKDVSAYVKKFSAFGWETFLINGHDIKQILNAFAKAKKSKKPVAIIAKTFKGNGVSFLKNKEGWHGKALSKEQLSKALKELGKMPVVDSKKFVKAPKQEVSFIFKQNNFININYKMDEQVSTRAAFGNALVKLGKANNSFVVLDGDVKNSTMTEYFFKKFPKRSFECFIAEQNMIGMAVGFSAKGFVPIPSSFSAFLSRAHDNIRMAAYSFSNIKFVGSHSGISIGEDGPSQMGLEDLAMFTPIPNSVVLYPCDAVSAEACTALMLNHKGICYLRTSRPATKIVYINSEDFKVGGSKVLRKTDEDVVTVVAAGITVHEALKAHEALKEEGIFIRVIDAYSIKPIDAKTILENAHATNQRIIVVEDHYGFGGLGEAVRQAVGNTNTIRHLFVNDIPRSGRSDELLDKYGISADNIIKEVKKFL